MRTPTLVLVAALAVASGPEARAGDLVGTVRYAGSAPAPAPMPTTKDRAVCGSEVDDETLLVADGRLANAILRVKGAPPGPPVTITLGQERCRYRPHAQVAPVGSTLEITNGDPLLHSVHGWAGRVTRFDVVIPSRGMRIPTRLEKHGIIHVRCDVHSWMTAVVMVADGPAAITGRDGTFEIRDLPAGTYAVTAWHERLGEKTVEVAIPARGAVNLELSFGS